MNFFSGVGGQFDFGAWDNAGKPDNPPESPGPPPVELGPKKESQVIEPKKKPPGGFKPGDWECNACENVNFAKRNRCKKCGVARPKGDEAAMASTNNLAVAAGPLGLFKKGDWPCQHCGNVNWARRDRCNLCNAPKPQVSEEPRTGRAGGHFDLQDPNDKNAHYSDDEIFDEFGRRKRKRRDSEGTESDEESPTKYSKIQTEEQPSANTTTADEIKSHPFPSAPKLAFPSAPALAFPPAPSFEAGGTSSSSEESGCEDSDHQGRK